MKWDVEKSRLWRDHWQICTSKMPKKTNVKLISEVDMGMYYVSVKVHSESDLYICVKYFRAVKGCNSECKWVSTFVQISTSSSKTVGWKQFVWAFSFSQFEISICIWYLSIPVWLASAHYYYIPNGMLLVLCRNNSKCARDMKGAFE